MFKICCLWKREAVDSFDSVILCFSGSLGSSAGVDVLRRKMKKKGTN